MDINKEIICDYLNNDYNKKQIMSKYNLKLRELNNIFKQNNIKNKIQKNIDVNCFKNIDNNDKAYLLGLLVSDGSIDKMGYGFQLCSKDIELLKYAKIILHSEHKIITVNTFDKRTNKNYTHYNIRFSRKEIVNDLKILGLTNNKSLTAKMPNIENKYIWHFIRGIFDGDGSIHGNDGKLRFSIIGSYDIILFIQNLFIENNLSKTKIIKIKTKIENEFIYKIKMNSFSDLLYLRENIYKNANFYLKRKYNKFLELKQYRNGGYNRHNNKIWKKIKSIDKINNIEMIFDNIKLCSDYHNIKNTKMIYKIVNKPNRTYKKLIFEYL